MEMKNKRKLCVFHLSRSPVGQTCLVFGLGKGGGLVGPQASISKNEDHEFSHHLFMNEVSKI